MENGWKPRASKEAVAVGLESRDEFRVPANLRQNNRTRGVKKIGPAEGRPGKFRCSLSRKLFSSFTALSRNP